MTKTIENDKSWKKSKGILTDNERRFLENQQDYNKAMKSYYKLNIERKTKQVLIDLQYILDKFSWDEQINLLLETPDEILKSLQKMIYFRVRREEFLRRRKLGRKLKVNEKLLKQKTFAELRKILEF